MKGAGGEAGGMLKGSLLMTVASAAVPCSACFALCDYCIFLNIGWVYIPSPPYHIVQKVRQSPHGINKNKIISRRKITPPVLNAELHDIFTVVCVRRPAAQSQAFHPHNVFNLSGHHADQHDASIQSVNGLRRPLQQSFSIDSLLVHHH
jgi:hypothetical protein